MRIIVVAGGAGFIGTNLVMDLLQDPQNNVYVLDNFSTGSLLNLEESGAMRCPNFFYWNTDIREESYIKHLFTTHQVASVYNLACPASPVAYQKDPIGTWETSVLGTRNLVNWAIATGARFLQASTSEVYGDPAIWPQSEEYWGHVNPVGVRACYDEGKRAAEALLMDYYRMGHTKIRIARIFNTYGPYMAPDDGRVVSNFIMAALGGQPMMIYGNGQQTRCLCYISDMVLALRSYQMAFQAVSPIMNFGTPVEQSIFEISYAVDEALGTHSQRQYHPLPPDDPRRRRPDITKAMEQLGWYPSVQLRDGIRRTARWFQCRTDPDPLPDPGDADVPTSR